MEADIAYRAQAALGGISALLNGLHPRLRLDQSTIRPVKTFKTFKTTCEVGGKAHC